MKLSDYITRPSPDNAKTLTLAEFEQILTEVHESLPEKPKPGEPIVLDEYEQRIYKERGQVIKHWRDGTMTLIMTLERKAELEKLLK